jgi:hypothetical protein
MEREEARRGLAPRARLDDQHGVDRLTLSMPPASLHGLNEINYCVTAKSVYWRSSGG